MSILDLSYNKISNDGLQDIYEIFKQNKVNLDNTFQYIFNILIFLFRRLKNWNLKKILVVTRHP